MLKHIPNALTLIRLFLAPMIALLVFQGYLIAMVAPSLSGSWDIKLREMAAYLTLAAVFFVIAALTDLFDGIAARAFNAHSKFGRIIDPIADKALVGLPLVAVAFMAGLGGGFQAAVIICATAVIVIRDLLVTVVRLTSPDGEGARVSVLAKWKTALELFVVGAVLIGMAVSAQILGHYPPTPIYELAVQAFEIIWIVLLVIAAALSAYTGWQYLRPAKPAP